MLGFRHATAQALITDPDGGVEAFALYAILKGAHPFPDAEFGLNFDGMKKAGLIHFGERKFHTAKQLLLSHGYIKKVANHIAGKRSIQYMLTGR